MVSPSFGPSTGCNCYRGLHGCADRERYVAGSSTCLPALDCLSVSGSNYRVGDSLPIRNASRPSVGDTAMNERRQSAIALAASLALAGLAIVFAQSIRYAAVLIGTAIVLVLATASWRVWESLPRLFTDPVHPREAARAIYRSAARCGGTIHATHIFPLDRDPQGDYAVAELSRSSPDTEISFHRILLLDSLGDERQWLELLFQRLHPAIDKRFYVLSSYPLQFPRVAKALVPRLNLLLYQAPGGRSHQALVGLDRLHLAGITVNFALQTRSQRVYRALLRYFEAIMNSGYFSSCSTIDEYNANQSASSQFQRGQDVISRVVTYAETTAGVMCVGIFGSVARAALGVTADVLVEDTDADVDLLVVVDPHLYGGDDRDLREALGGVLDDSRAQVTWGPDLSVFYPFRDERRINVDIECHHVGSDFYANFRLLGYSIFRYFLPLYCVDQRPIASYLDLPMVPLTMQERWDIVVSDRQGLRYFRERLAAGPLQSTDPRRLCSHVLRNLVWAITGSWPSGGRVAGRFLADLADWAEGSAVQRSVELLSLSTEDVRRDLRTAFATVSAMVDFALSHER